MPLAFAAGVGGVIVEQVEEVQMLPHVVADCNEVRLLIEMNISGFVTVQTESTEVTT
jgi:hypothetical protein